MQFIEIDSIQCYCCHIFYISFAIVMNMIRMFIVVTFVNVIGYFWIYFSLSLSLLASREIDGIEKINM